jgi:hypothetical protein
MANNNETFTIGMDLVRAELENREFLVSEEREGRSTYLKIHGNGANISIKTKTKRSEKWQLDKNDGVENARIIDYPNSFWIFINLINPDSPVFYVVPEHWIRGCMHRIYANYLSAHGGARPINTRSKHFGLEENEIQIWRDRWDLLIYA